LAAAVRVVLHVGRDRAGARRLDEIAVLRRGVDGMVAASTAWHADRGFDCGMAPLRDLLAARGRG
jgi:pilus assembly protein CpaF